ncbi:MAG: hypothetical protein ACRC3Y_10930, partial [Romboutsia sp.]|uniref:hypothetical protein n=1 Tax=Romboutsia sp. TaxID=1965302 RepID=UPI003F2D2F4F
ISFVIILSIVIYYNKKETIIKNIPSQSVKETKYNTKNNKEHTLLITSSQYNALVCLNEDTKDVKIEVLEDQSNPAVFDNYINLNDDDIKYLKENSDSILNNIKESSLFEKYQLITSMLEKYDTDISVSDILSIGLKYTK